MSASPLVSVIVPVHDVEHHVTACLRSLRKQSVADFEVIVVDDGSRDASLARARAAMADDPRFRLISRPHAGLSAARNAGLAAARGTFIGFVDGDGSDDLDDLPKLLNPILDESADFVIASRARGQAEAGALTPPQRLGNLIASSWLRYRFGQETSDLGPFRAIRKTTGDGYS